MNKLDTNPEHALLGSILMDNEQYYQALEHINGPEDFQSPKNAELFRGLSEMIENGMEADPVTVCEFSREQEHLDALETKFLAKCVNSCPAVGRGRYYAEYVKKNSMRDEIAEVLEDIDPYNTQQSPSDLIGGTISELERISERKSNLSIQPVSAGLQELNEMVGTADERGKPDGWIRTGFGALDSRINYLAPSDFVMLTAKSGVGKTTFTMNVADYVADNEGPVFIYTGEMAGYEIAIKMIAMESGVEIDDMLKGRMNADDWERYERACKLLEQKDIYIVTGTDTRLSDFKAAVRRAKKEHDCVLCILDYIQLIKGPPGIEENQWLNMLSSEVMGMTNDIQIPIMAISRTNKRGEVYGASELEFDCNYHLYLSVCYDKDDKYGKVDNGKRLLAVRKARLAEGGVIELMFQGECSRFSEEGF